MKRGTDMRRSPRIVARRPLRATTSPRKLPRQARAQATVGAILEATVQILDREGLEAATTTRIAEVAGVSVGSLYQYFSHRDAILNALQEREFERALVLMQRVLARAGKTAEGDPHCRDAGAR